MLRARWKITPWHMLGGAVLYSGSTYAFYSFLADHKLPADPAAASAAAAAGPHSGTFDAIAAGYDSAIGSEEWSMGTHHLRKWVLNHAAGDVLEVSAGTGRNLPHYTLSKIKSLTLTDLSLHMLQRAEDKYYDDLKLGERHPGTKATFCICDAHCMVVEAPAAPWVHTLPALRQAQAAGQGYGAAQPEQPPATGSGSWTFPRIFRFGSKSGSRARDDAAASGGAAAEQLPGSSGSETSRGSAAAAGSVWKPWTWFRAKAPEPEPCCGNSYPARCRQGCTEAGLPLSKFRTASFDTVVDAFGLCSHEDPVQVLREMSRVCKPGGKILLLEHGRGHYDWINARLDGGAERHLKKWGCWWNRDIEAIVSQAGLRVEKTSRRHFGTTYVCVARPALQG